MGARAISDEKNWADAPATAAPRVIIASGVLLYREGLAASLACDGRLDVLAKVDVADAVDSVAVCRPDAVLVDATIEEGRLLGRRLHASWPKTPLIGFGITGDSSSFIACAEAGFSAFVGCHGTIDNLVAAVVGALRGELVCTPRFASMLCGRLAALASEHTNVDDPLTPREREVAALVVEGRSNKEIAIVLRIGPATVKNHVHNILDKLRISRRAGIASRLDQAVA